MTSFRRIIWSLDVHAPANSPFSRVLVDALILHRRIEIGATAVCHEMVEFSSPNRGDVDSVLNNTRACWLVWSPPTCPSLSIPTYTH